MGKTQKNTSGERNSIMTDGNRHITFTAPLVACIAVATGTRIYLRDEVAQRAASFGAVRILEGDNGK